MNKMSSELKKERNRDVIQELKGAEANGDVTVFTFKFEVRQEVNKRVNHVSICYPQGPCETHDWS